MFMIFLFNLQRKIRASLSFFYNKTEKVDFKIEKIINETHNLLIKNFKLKKIEKKKTHKIFSKEIFELIKNKEQLNFLQNSRVQKIFFIHNRIFLLKYFLRLYFSEKWFFWKKILKENNIGNPIRYFLIPFTSGNKIFQAYHLKKYEDSIGIKVKDFDLIFEFGGGYGNMASNFNIINKKSKYFIFDTFEVSLLQYYYLRRMNLDVNFNSNKIKKINLYYSLDSLKKCLKKNKQKKKLFIANWSLSEVPFSLRSKLKFVFNDFNFQLISFQNQFEGINNLKYFKNINLLNKSKKRSSLILGVDNYKDNCYLFSKKKI